MGDPPKPILRKGARGIDVSGWQSQPIPWGELDLDFAVVKATEGLHHVSKGWTIHAKPVVQAGRVLGAYHFLHTDADIADQAEHFLSTVLWHGPAPSFAALDIEWSKKHDAKMKPRRRVKKVLEWVRLVRDALGVPVLVYTQASYYRYRLASHIALRPLPLWQAGSKVLPGWEPTLIQSKGRVEGVHGAVDIDTAARSLWPLAEALRV